MQSWRFPFPDTRALCKETDPYWITKEVLQSCVVWSHSNQKRVINFYIRETSADSLNKMSLLPKWPVNLLVLITSLLHSSADNRHHQGTSTKCHLMTNTIHVCWNPQQFWFCFLAVPCTFRTSLSSTHAWIFWGKNWTTSLQFLLFFSLSLYKLKLNRKLLIACMLWSWNLRYVSIVHVKSHNAIKVYSKYFIILIIFVII